MSMSDMFVIIVAAFGLAFSVFFVYMTVSFFSTNAHDAIVAAGGTTTPLDQTLGALRTFDWGIAFFVFMSGLASVALAVFVKTHPIFYIFSLIYQLFLVMISAVFSNIFIDFTANPTIAAVTVNFPITMFVFGVNFPIIVLIISALIAIAQFASPSGGGAGI